MADAERREIDFDSQDLGMQGITEEERREIEEELNAVVNQTAQPPALERQYALPQRSGVLLPVMVWIVAAAVATGGYFFLQSRFQTRENDITVEGRQFFGAEAQLISNIIEENNRRLAEKDAEIDQIQDQLALLNQERDQFEQNIEAEVAAREAELRAELEAELAAERERLASEGVSEEEINQQISTLETEREAELESQVASLQEEAQQQLTALEQQLAEQEAALEQELAESRAERQQIEAEANERVAEAEARAAQLEQELGQEIEALEQAEAQAIEQIEQLRAQRENDQLLNDRILGSFAVILEDIQDGLTEQAISGLDSLERLLLDQQATGGDTDQLQTELALASTLRGLVREVGVLRQNLAVRDLTTTAGQSSEIERERAAELIQTASETATLAEQARAAGRFTEARTLYQQALATIPSLDAVYPGILDLESTRRQVALQTAVSEAESLLAEGEAGAAVDRYLTGLQTIAANDEDPLLAVASGIDTAVSLTANELLDLQEEIQNELEATIAARNQQIATLQNQLASARARADAASLQLAPLEEQISELEEENRALEQQITEQRSATSEANQDLTALEDRIEDLEGELSVASTRTENLQEQLDEARSDLSSANSQLTSSEQRVSELESELSDALADLAAAEEAAASAGTESAQSPQEDGTTVDSAELAALETELEAAREELATLREDNQQRSQEQQSLEAALEESEAETERLRELVASLRETRDDAGASVQELEAQVASLEQQLSQAESAQEDVEQISAAYQQALGRATSQLSAGQAEAARRTLLSVFARPEAAELFPRFTTALEQAHRQIVQEAESQTGGEARAEAIDNVLSLVDEVQENIEDPRDASTVQSYLRREPDLQDVGTGLFEIVELASRQISAPEIEYRLLGSVSRVTGNLIVVERLVTTPTEVGTRVELRRTPSLGQEIPIAQGTVLEVSEDRILVGVEEIYDLEQPPRLRDVVYLEQQ
jgi:chromosome segregation ATPase